MVLVLLTSALVIFPTVIIAHLVAIILGVSIVVAVVIAEKDMIIGIDANSASAMVTIISIIIAMINATINVIVIVVPILEVGTSLMDTITILPIRLMEYLLMEPQNSSNEVLLMTRKQWVH